MTEKQQREAEIREMDDREKRRQVATLRRQALLPGFTLYERLSPLERRAIDIATR